jgi:hypothetical protein
LRFILTGKANADAAVRAEKAGHGDEFRDVKRDVVKYITGCGWRSGQISKCLFDN